MTGTLSVDKNITEALEKIKTFCTKHSKTIAVAESVTAGSIQLLLSTAPQAQQFFQGGITAYNCSQKAIHLNIDPIFAERCNAVAQSVADQMAQQVCALFRSQIGIGVTGYATRMPEEGINDLFAYATIVSEGQVRYQGKIHAEKEGIEAQEEYAKKLIQLLSETPL